MKKLLLGTALLSIMAFPAFADGYDLTVKSIDELAEDTSAAASADFLVRFDDSADKFVKVGADDLNANFGVTATATEINTTVDGATATAAELNQAADISVNSELVTTANTLTTAECGELLFIDSATGFAHTLPAPTQGCKFDFVIKTDSTGTNHTIVTTGAETILGFNLDASGLASTGTQAADTITFNSSTAVPGDRVSLFSDGTSWHTIAFSSANAAIAFSSSI